MTRDGGHPRFRIMSRFVVPNYDSTGEDYLRRLRIIETPWFGVFLHRLGTPE